MNVVRKKKNFLFIMLLLVGVLAFAAACGGNNNEAGGGNEAAADATPTPTPTPVPEVVTPVEVLDAVNALADLHELEAQFPRHTNHTGTMIPGGDFHRSVTLTTVFTTFEPHLTQDSFNGEIADFMNPPIIPSNDAGRILFGPDGHDAPAYVTIDLENNSITYNLRRDVEIFWSDGVRFTLDAMMFAYEHISHPDYTGIRWGAVNGTSLVVGAAEFKAGEVDYISGLVLSEDEHTLTVYFTEMSPSLQFNMLSRPSPRHHFEGIPVGQIEWHSNSREDMIGFGPFLVDIVDPGAPALILVANENYWRGRPHIDRIVFSPIDPELSAEAIRNGQLDQAGFRLLDWPYHNDLNNGTFLGRINNSQGPLLHFVLGSMHLGDDGNYYIVPRDDNHPITDPIVRRAMAYAVDRLTIDVEFNQGFGRPATSILSPFNAEEFIDPYDPGLSLFDIERANQMLDEAGYVMGPDGFRLDLDGNPFHVNFALWHTLTNEIIFEMHRQNMAAIGIDFRLLNDGWTDWNWISDHAFAVHGIHDHALDNNTDMHIFQMSWIHSANPNPYWLWGPGEGFNGSRIQAPAFTEPLQRMNTVEAWDPDFFAQALRDFSAAYNHYVPAVTASWSVGLYVINHRVVGWNWLRGWNVPGETRFWHEIYLTAEAPIPHN